MAEAITKKPVAPSVLKPKRKKAKKAVQWIRKKMTSVAGNLKLRVITPSATVTIRHADGSSTDEPQGGADYVFQPGDEAEAAAGVTFELQAAADTVVQVVDDDPAQVTVEDAGFFESIEEYYDEEGGTTWGLQLEDGFISIRG